MRFNFLRDSETRMKLGCVVFLLLMVIVISVLLTRNIQDTALVCTWCTS